MKTIATAAAALILTWGAVSPVLAQTRPSTAVAGVDPVASVRRTTLLVEDIDRAVDFYQRLGLIKAADRTSTATDAGGVLGASESPLTADPTAARLVVLRGSNDRDGVIALLGYDKPRLPSARGNLIGVGAGDVVIELEVDSINDAYRRLSQIGTHFHRTPFRFNEMNVDGVSVSGQRLLAFDPDGHLIDVIQIERK